MEGHDTNLSSVRQQVFRALTRLSDRDTQESAVREVESIASDLTPETIYIILNALYDIDDKIVASGRKHGIKLFGIISEIFGPTIQQHLPKIAAFLSRRLKSADKTVIGACVSSFETLAACSVPDPPSPDSLTVFFKPLFAALSDQDKVVQGGVLACVGGVAKGGADKGFTKQSLPRLCGRLAQKFHTNLNKGALMDTLGTLVEACGNDMADYVDTFVPLMTTAAINSDWQTRQSAASTLETFALYLSTEMGLHRSKILSTLDTVKFDKVKPAREAITAAMEVYEALGPTTSYSSSRHAKKSSSSKNSQAIETPQFETLDSISPGARIKLQDVQTHKPLEPAEVEELNLDPMAGSAHAQRAGEKGGRRISLLKQPVNEEFFKQAEADAAPIVIKTPEKPPRAWGEALQEEVGYSDQVTLTTPSKRSSGGTPPSTKRDESAKKRVIFASPNSPRGKLPPSPTYTMSTSYSPSKSPHKSTSVNAAATNHSSSASFANNVVAGGVNNQSGYRSTPSAPSVAAPPTTLQSSEYKIITTQLDRLFQQQDRVMGMFEKLNNTVQGQIGDLDRRMTNLEAVVQEMRNVHSIRSSGHSYATAHIPDHHVISSTKRDRSSSPKRDRSRERERSASTEAYAQRRAIEEALTERMGSSMGAAIGGGGSGGGGNASSTSPGSSSKSALVWEQALGHITQGHLDDAYKIILQARDELQLVRLMGRTGPVFHQLHSPTIGMLFDKFCDFMQTHNFLDNVFQWLQVAVDADVAIPREQRLKVVSRLQAISQSSTPQGLRAGVLRTKILRAANA